MNEVVSQDPRPLFSPVANRRSGRANHVKRRFLPGGMSDCDTNGVRGHVLKNANICGRLMALLIFLGGAAPASADDLRSCFRAASIRYDISQRLLEAIAQVESSGNPMAINKNGDGSEDIGLMQINSSWLSKLRSYGIERSDLFDPCVSINVGAWIMADNIFRHGYNWKAVGAYNAVSPDKRLKYAHKVALALLSETGPTWGAPKVLGDEQNVALALSGEGVERERKSLIRTIR